jgi:hypothetical protein
MNKKKEEYRLEYMYYFFFSNKKQNLNLIINRKNNNHSSSKANEQSGKVGEVADGHAHDHIAQMMPEEHETREASEEGA